VRPDSHGGDPTPSTTPLMTCCPTVSMIQPIPGPTGRPCRCGGGACQWSTNRSHGGCSGGSGELAGRLGSHHAGSNSTPGSITSDSSPGAASTAGAVSSSGTASVAAAGGGGSGGGRRATILDCKAERVGKRGGCGTCDRGDVPEGEHIELGQQVR
jgi:hypothetical protein